MKITCGTDIIEVKRIKDAINKKGDKFLNKIYTPFEIEYCNSKNSMQYQHFAARFAAKEAIFKAISEKMKSKYEITWTDVEIKNDEEGKPKVVFLKENYNINQIDISISHVKEYAIAMCIVESDN